MPCFRVAYEGKEFQLEVTIVIAPWERMGEKKGQRDVPLSAALGAGPLRIASRFGWGLEGVVSGIVFLSCLLSLKR